uniref:G-type lectin S-receptor-like serine/threonine-protein kinase At4g27290 n=1 Tax=Erigeron canadensis TaxID=72917 RepID=UPI001CB9BAB9|nr:G-type lectin S-receptor-like serine/threonine-protein kinase At4g27290 [Erigeron canadensis]
MLLLYIALFFLTPATCSSLDTIVVFQNFTDGQSQTIVSTNDRFELGFFSPGTSINRYLGIWFKYTSPHRVIWVANRETPLINTMGRVILDRQGVLSLVNGSTVIWSSNSSVSKTEDNFLAQLLDTGNLVIKSGNNVLWQSFDYPGDTFISGMKLGKDLVTGQEMYMTSWRSADDPSPGEYTVTYTMVKGKYEQVYIRKNSVIQSRVGPYNGVEFAGQPNYKPNPVYVYKIDMLINDREMYFTYTYNSTTFAVTFTVTPTGKLEVWHLNMRNQVWMKDLTLPIDNCDNYGLCGPYGSCSTLAYPNCGCLKGFVFKNPEDLSPDNWTSGCRRNVALNCAPGEGFYKFSSMKLPDTVNAVYNGNLSLEECKVACKNNCSCNAYANPNTNLNGVGCLLWFGDLIDTRVYPQNGQDLYVRLAASELLDVHFSIHKRKRVVVASSISAGLAMLGVISALYIWSKRKWRSDAVREGRSVKILDKDHNSSSKNGSIELAVFSLSRISKATDNFSIANQLGEGGFGPVYKGVLEGGLEIAVKRLSKYSRQGLDEFENEVICIAKLQHRNLVKLLGYCIQRDETMLVYEYMHNKSLDWFIFDDSRKSLLDWPQRFHIINGIARGLLYLHQDSRLRVVHRDLKAGNILLDHDMNPKISDFGLARMFKGHESEANTKKVVGTLGYISPEYAVNGLFSVKSDIFSFGVLVLEIVSGKKNTGFAHEDHHDNLLGYAWRLYKEGKSLDLIDTSLGKAYSVSEVLRSVHIGLLCVQQRAQDRPTTPSVVSMLGGEGSLPSPKQPGFFIQGSEKGSTSIIPLPSSVNVVTLTQVEAR